MALRPGFGRVRELTDEELQDVKNDLRWLLNEGGWSVRNLNEALGFQSTSNMLRNMMYDTGTKFSTTRARYDAIKRIRAENLKPGVTLIAETTKPRKSKTEATPPPVEEAPRRRTRRTRAEMEAANAAAAVDATPAVPALTFNMGETRIEARQQEDGNWRVALAAICTTEQMLAWTQQVLAGQLSAGTTLDSHPLGEDL
jgi:hypothetical protein